MAEIKKAHETIQEMNADLEHRVSLRTQALHESEERLRSILDAAIDSIITINSRGIIETVNPAAEQMFGYSLAELIGQNVKMLIPSPHREAHDGYFATFMGQGIEGINRFRREIVAQHKDGTIFTAELAVGRVSLPGQPKFTGVVRDTTVSKRTEKALAHAKEVAEAANQAKSEFLTAMSHDLRTPLNGILGMNDLLVGTELTDRQRQFVDASHISGKLLMQLINNVLDLSKIESGKLELDLQECFVETLVYDVVEALGPGAIQKGLMLNVHVDSAASVTALCDGNRLRQILVNLIGNAIKFTASGAVTVNVTGTCRHDQQLCLRFEVNDTGIGIPENQCDKLFSPFTQVDRSTTRKFGGSGLGLSICKQLITLMNGSIGIDSQIGIGSTFWFEVPLPVIKHREESPSARRQLNEMRVLLVEDEQHQRRHIVDCLTSWGCRTTSVASDNDARLAVVRATTTDARIDLAIIDLQTTSGNRYSLIDELSRRQGLPVIAIGSSADFHDADWLRQRGIQRLLLDPVRPSALCDALMSTLATTSSILKPCDTDNSPTPISTPVPLTGHVLIAEDNRINQMYVTELLKHCGCTCDVAANGDEALEAVQRGVYDLILMDCQMPEMDGFTASREIRRRSAAQELPHSIPIIALTANALKGDRERCLEAGMDDYLTKPIELKRMQEVLQRFLATCPPKSQPDLDHSSVPPHIQDSLV